MIWREKEKEKISKSDLNGRVKVRRAMERTSRYGPGEQSNG